VVCPLCGQRRVRRDCPALGQHICAICCGTKRLVQIECPSTCTYLSAAREHPPAAVVRRKQRDLERLVPPLRDLSERQSQLCFALTTFLARYSGPEFLPLTDADVAEAAAALAATLETSARGVIYEHRPASLPAERLATSLRPLLTEAGKRGGSAFERDAAVVLRRMEEAARNARLVDHGNDRAFLDLLKRTTRPSDQDTPSGERAGPSEPRLIIP
jgi:hypothetical protein